jgi:hypothetical protein
MLPMSNNALANHLDDDERTIQIYFSGIPDLRKMEHQVHAFLNQRLPPLV